MSEGALKGAELGAWAQNTVGGGRQGPVEGRGREGREGEDQIPQNQSLSNMKAAPLLALLLAGINFFGGRF